MKLIFDIAELEPYVNWLYFCHAWGLDGKSAEVKASLKQEAEAVLHSWQGRYKAYAVFRLLSANSDGDDLVLDGVRVPMLRQQRPSPGKDYCLCLADFVRPLSSHIADRAGVFATSVDITAVKGHEDDAYAKMMAQVLADRLAEAAAERMHQLVRTTYWGYAPDEQLSMKDLLAERYQGIRPAVGYPSLPDTSVNFTLNELLDFKQIGVRLTESGMMVPHASVSGFLFSHPKSRYFDLGKIGEDQLRDYARRRGVPVEMIRRFIGASTLRR